MPHHYSNADIMRAIGRLEGKVEEMSTAQTENTKAVRRLERAEALSGAISGGIISVGVSLLFNAITGGSQPGGS